VTSRREFLNLAMKGSALTEGAALVPDGGLAARTANVRRRRPSATGLGRRVSTPHATYQSEGRAATSSQLQMLRERRTACARRQCNFCCENWDAQVKLRIMNRETYIAISGAAAALIALAAGRVDAASINSIVNEALRSNPELESYRAAIAIARGERRTAAEYPNPDANTELGVKTITGGGHGTGQLWTIGFLQSVDLPSRRALRKAIADRQIELAELALQNFELELANRVRLLGYRAIIARKKAAAAAEVAAHFRDLTRVLSERAPAGVAPALETRIVEAGALAFDQARVEAEAQMWMSVYELNQLRGASPEVPIDLEEEELQLTPLLSAAQLLTMARSGNFDLRMRQVELAQQGYNVQLSRSQKWTGISAGPFVHRENADTHDLMAGVSVRLPLPLWNQNKGAIESARARELQMAASLNAVLRKVENEVAAAAAMYNARLREIDRWTPEVLGRMREAAETADKNYRTGAIPLTTYTELQKQYLDAQTALLTAQANALEARQKVKLLTGQRDTGRTSRERATQFSK
jgi:outer membrane protein, heavy metal efflux system